MFTDGSVGLFDNDGEIEPIVHEVVRAYRANPTEMDRRIRVLALDGEGYQFLASDVLTYQWRDTFSPEFTLLYPVHVKMFALWNGTKIQLYYVVKEDDILGVINV